jgi:hypothetical protein
VARFEPSTLGITSQVFNRCATGAQLNIFKNPKKLGREQGDQIGQIFIIWQLFNWVFL